MLFRSEKCLVASMLGETRVRYWQLSRTSGRCSVHELLSDLLLPLFEVAQIHNRRLFRCHLPASRRFLLASTLFVSDHGDEGVRGGRRGEVGGAGTYIESRYG